MPITSERETAGRAAEADRPSQHGQTLGRALAMIAMIGRKDAPFEIPEICGTCAFREGSLPNQTAATGIMALNCVLGIDRDRFACHHDMKDGEPQRLCFGYAAALFAPFSKVKIILASLHEDLAHLSEQDDVRARFDEWLSGIDPEIQDDVYALARQYRADLATLSRVEVDHG